ncbi:MAG: SDR family oxidoreductase [Caulobacteraceae bacterium]|nr:SDR family oxidoreductase [Caulobacteraceae bacterium]
MTIASPSAARYADLAGKTVLVTGSSKALGADTARAFGAQGAQVVVHGRDRAAVDAVVRTVQDAGGTCVGLTADLTDRVAVEGLRDRLRSEFTEFAQLDVLACFAGGMGQPTPTLGMDESLWRRTLDVDLTSKFLTVQAFAPAMRDRGQGSIILMSSTAGRQVSEATAAYGAAQAGLLMFMRHLARELGPSGVRVNAIAPSIVRNERIEKHMPAEIQAQAAKALPLRRIGEASDVANAALFLASDASSWITGQVIDVNGGKVMT